MTERAPLLLIAVAGLQLGCITLYPLQPIEPNTEATVLATVYTRSHFQPRCVPWGKCITPLVKVIPVDQPYTSYDEEWSSLELEAPEYQSLLGAFDLVEHFKAGFAVRTSDLSTLRIVITEDPDFHDGIVGATRVASGAEKFPVNPVVPDEAFHRDIVEDGFGAVLAIKVTYGIGLRTGPEQLGVTKTYRPFVLILGTLVSVPERTLIWKNVLLGFAEQSYRGGEADADVLDPEQLVESLREVADRLAADLVDDLNGYPVSTHPETLIPLLDGNRGELSQ